MTHRQDFHVRQGETWSHVHTHRNSAGNAVDLTGYTARMRVAVTHDGMSEAFLATEGDGSGGSLTLGGASGTITIGFSAEQSRKLAAYLSILVAFRVVPPSERYADFIYDLEIESAGGVVTRVLEGQMRVQREVTK